MHNNTLKHRYSLHWMPKAPLFCAFTFTSIRTNQHHFTRPLAMALVIYYLVRVDVFLDLLPIHCDMKT